MEFKDALRRRREYLGLSPEQLAAMITRHGAPTNAADIQYWERGRNSAPLENALFRQALAAALQIPVEKIERSMRLLEREPPPPPIPAFSARAMRGAELIDSLPDHLSILALSILQTMLRSCDTPSSVHYTHQSIDDVWD
jgi:transcriptional regulator with XRE-family HTH domain